MIAAWTLRLAGEKDGDSKLWSQIDLVIGEKDGCEYSRRE